MRTALAIFFCTYFFTVNGLSQQYPFVNYTTKDGLVNNRMNSILQDNKGRLFFLTYNGLSIYDGARFTNYTTEDGLGNELVNDVMQMSDDSFWIATNTLQMDCLVHGKIKKLSTANNYCPLVNQLYRNAQQELFAAADGGLFQFKNNRFNQLNIIDSSGKNVEYISHIQAISNRLMLVQSLPVESKYVETLFLYDYQKQKIIASIPALNFTNVPDGNFWAMTTKGIYKLEINENNKTKLHLIALPEPYKKIASYITGIIYFDNNNDCWLTGKENHLVKCDKNGNITVFSTGILLYERQANQIFQDKEGTLWFCFPQNGISKLSATNLSLLNNVFGLQDCVSINYTDGNLIFLDAVRQKLAWIKNDNALLLSITGNKKISDVYATAKGIIGLASTEIYKLVLNGKNLNPIEIKTDKKFAQNYGKAIVDNYGNLVVSGNHYLTAVIDDKETFNIPVKYFADEITKDKSGNIWAANRSNDLKEFSVHPETPTQYLRLKNDYSNLLANADARSACFDSSGNFWVGSRFKGLLRFSFAGNKTSMLHLTKKQGLSDNFNLWLACDPENNIWSCSPSGLDKISFKNNKPVIANITQQSNIYEQVLNLVFDKDTTAWALNQTGNIIKITHQKQNELSYKPQVYLAYIKSGNDTLMDQSSIKFSYQNNNPSFYFASPSFLNERQIQYSYTLVSNNKNKLSETSTNAFINFINLTPGNYVLQTKVSYPAAIYPEQIIKTPFEVTPPWWQTTWFTLVLIFISAVIILGAIRFYVRSKLKEQRIALEKKQAIEKERTRIATDMHDDLGAGLSRIKFLSETINLKKETQQPVEEDISKIKDYAHDMIDKMGEIVWALNEKNDSLNDLLAYTRAYSMEYLTQNKIDCSITSPENIPAIFVTGETRRNIFLTIKEALHNIVKHANANHVRIIINTNNKIAVRICDDGVGFDTNNLRPFSNGVYNMQKRIQEIGGTIEIKNENGTIVSFEVPLQL